MAAKNANPKASTEIIQSVFFFFIALGQGNLHQMSSKEQGLKGHTHTMLSLIHRFRLEQSHGTKNRAWKPAQKNWE